MAVAPDRLTQILADRYRVERELGAGGMANVYLAHDIRHDRRVAIKVLRPELAAVIGAERFLSEIRTTANLQHPHILPLFESGQADSLLFYVMPYVVGESLRDRLNREKQLPIGEAVRVAKEVASALDYAHRHGVIHRDIKPENILLHDGQALVADFGIALAASNAGGGRMTETGLSLGTPHYMSPEQAMGEREITARSDVYALGAITYEMLTGEPPFTGPTAQSIVAKVMTEEPRSLQHQRKSIPDHVADAVITALEKLPADRFDTAAGFAAALSDAGLAMGRERATTGRRIAPVRQPWRDWRIVAAGVALLLAGAAAGRLSQNARTDESLVARFRISMGSGKGISSAPVNTLALSPDGKSIVYVGRTASGENHLYLRRLDELEANPIPGTRGAGFPAFSPDGRRVAYFASGGLFQIPLTGGAPTLVPNIDAQALTQAVWLDNGTLVATAADGKLVSLGLDGAMKTIAAPDSARGEFLLGVSAVLPDGRTALVVATNGAGANGSALAIDVETGRRTQLIDGVVNALWYSDGTLLWAQPGGALLGAQFDVGKLRTTSPAVTLAEGVRRQIGGLAQVAVSAGGSMVYIPELPFNLMLADRAGNSEILETGRRFHSPRFSPNGRFIAMDFIEGGARDVWTLDLRQRTISRVSFESDGHDPVWLRDGKALLYASRNGIFRRPADGGAAAESVFIEPRFTTAIAVTSDGRFAITAPTSTNGGFDIGLLPLEAGGQQRPLVATPFNEHSASLSADNRWMAYTSGETGRDEIYVRPFPEGGAKVVVSQNGGSEPVWHPSGRELFYVGQKDGVPYLFSATMSSDEGITVTSRTPLFDMSEFEPSEPHANYDVSPDGNRFALVHQGPLPEMIFVMKWSEEVRRRSTPAR